jgi:CMP-N,N'-diacetyllegionaminic acid synthase
MEKKAEILALIPARSGSKSLPDKNIRMVAGKPLLAYSIEHALASKLINRTIVSTDSPEYAEIARQHGAEVPFLRPPVISRDYSTDLEVFTHALKWLEENENYIPDICVHLRPTYPIRQVEDINKVIQILSDSPDIDSVRSVAPAPDTPFKMWLRGEDGLLSPVAKTDIKDAHSLPRQILPRTFIQNACIDAVRTSVIMKKKSMTGQKIYGYLMDENLDIDDRSQLRKAEEQLSKANVGQQKEASLASLLDQGKTFCFDIDGVVATIVPGNQYDLAQPQPENIHTINNLYSQGHRIILWTARGSVTGIDWTEVTRNQLKAWGVKYHELVFGKPAADYYIDDRSLSTEQLQTLVSE